MADTPDLGFEKQRFFASSFHCLNHVKPLDFTGENSLFDKLPGSVEKTMKVAQKVAQIKTGHFPAARSRVVIRLAQGTKAKPAANTRTLRPDKCLVVSSLSTGLRPGCPRNTVDNAATTRVVLKVAGLCVRRMIFLSLRAPCEGRQLQKRAQSVAHRP